MALDQHGRSRVLKLKCCESQRCKGAAAQALAAMTGARARQTSVSTAWKVLRGTDRPLHGVIQRRTPTLPAYFVPNPAPGTPDCPVLSTCCNTDAMVCLGRQGLLPEEEATGAGGPARPRLGRADRARLRGNLHAPCAGYQRLHQACTPMLAPRPEQQRLHEAMQSYGAQSQSCSQASHMTQLNSGRLRY